MLAMTVVLPFSIDLRPGQPISEQIVFAVKKAVIRGQLPPGAPFPSVRVLSEELKVNRNTAHKAIADLVSEGVLLTTPAVGSVVAEAGAGSRAARTRLVAGEAERLVVESRRLGLTLADIEAAVAEQWRKLGP